MVSYTPGTGDVICHKERDIVTKFTDGGVDYIRKEFGSRKIWPFSRLARYRCNREVAALMRVKGVPGLQQIVEKDSPTSFISKYEDGNPITSPGVTEDYFLKLEGLIDTTYKTGVVLLDLKTTNGLLVDDQGNPKIVGFGAAIIYDPQKNSRTWRKIFDSAYILSKAAMINRKQKLLVSQPSHKEIETMNQAAHLRKAWALQSSLMLYLGRVYFA